MNTTSLAERPMNTTILNYPGFHTLPKGIKQMLVASEAHFFDQPASHDKEQRGAHQGMRANGGFKVLFPKGGKGSPALAHTGQLFCTFAQQL
jgi:hypothetical protein